MGSYPYPSLTRVSVGDKDDTTQSNPVGCHKNVFSAN